MVLKFFSSDDLEHLLASLRAHYTIKVDRKGANYCGLKIDWDYKQGHVDISMPGIIPKALHKFQHPPPKKPQYAPHTWIPPVHGQKVQHALPPETLPVLDKKGTKRVPFLSRTGKVSGL